MQAMRIFTVAQDILASVSGTFSPPAGATSRQVRVNGAITFSLSIVLLIASFLAFIGMQALIPDARIPSGLFMLIVFGFYAMAMVGGYRLIAGKSPQAADATEFSSRRLLIGLGSVLLAMATCVLLAWCADFILALGKAG